MITKESAYNNIIQLLQSSNAVYKSFTHRSALTYEDLLAVQKETGFFGTEGKCMVLKTEGGFVVYVTISSQRVNFDAITEFLKCKKVRLASKEELKDHFDAEPGCAYPFGFESIIPIYVDPQIYAQEWFLFSPAVSTKTIQVRGADLKTIFEMLRNPVAEVLTFNIHTQSI